MFLIIVFVCFLLNLNYGNTFDSIELLECFIYCLLPQLHAYARLIALASQQS